MLPINSGSRRCAVSGRTHTNVTLRSCVRAHYVRADKQRPEYTPNRISDPNYVRIFDTTLRDGEQSPGASLTSKQKLGIAKQLSKLGVDVIEAGFPVASPDDFEAVKLIAHEVGNDAQPDGYVPVICAMARTVTKDLDSAWEAVRHAQRPRVHTLIATSEIHMTHKLRMTPDQVIARAVDAVAYLKSLGCHDIEFTAEDASRSDPDFVCKVVEQVIKAGATTIMIPDTVGWQLSPEYSKLIAHIKAHTKGIDDVIISAHCHDDLGCSTSNSLAAAMAGARQIECTINGIGERAGNASLEEIVMAIKLKGDELMGGLRTGVNPVHLYTTSQMVSQYSGMLVQPNKAIVGANAFSHESGMHQDGMLKHRETYQIMSPETIGLSQKSGEAGIVLGKHSGRHALASHLNALGYDLSRTEVDELFKRFKVLADVKKVITDEDLLGLVGDNMDTADAAGWEVLDLHVVRTNGIRTCTVHMKDAAGVHQVGMGKGPGPVAAAYKAIDSLYELDHVPELSEYTVNSLTEGIEALVTTRVIIQDQAPDADHEHAAPEVSAARKKRVFSGQGTDEDIVVSSARAYVAALNKLVAWKTKQQQQQQEQQEETQGQAQGAAVEGRDGKASGKQGSGKLVAAR